MLQRTKGRLLLALLVMTGLAGTVNDNSLSQQEKKQAIAGLKSSRTELVKTVAGLSPRQLHYKPKGKPSVQELLSLQLQLEEQTWFTLKQLMSQPVKPETRIELAKTVRPLPLKEVAMINLAKAPAVQANGADQQALLDRFKLVRQNGIKYVKSSTEDFKNRFIHTEGGLVNSYNYVLLAAEQSRQLTQAIAATTRLPTFPRE